MKKIIRSLFVITAILCFMASAAFAAPADELAALFMDMNKVNNGKVTMKADGKFLDNTFNMLAKFNFESKPLTLIRGEAELTICEDGDAKKASKKAYEFYVEDNDKEYTYYYTKKGKNEWYKDSVSNDDKKTEKDAVEAAASKMDAKLIEELTGNVEYDANFTGKDDKVGYKVTVDMGKFAEIMSQVAMEGAKKEEAKDIEAFREVAKNLPPLSYTIVGDTKKREITAVNMSFTKFLQGSGQAIANSNSIDATTKLLAVMALSNAELTLNLEGNDYNKVKVEKLPDNIKKKAKQVEDTTAKK